MLEYELIVKDILNNEEFLKRKHYAHHGNITVYEHSLNVSKMAFKIAKKFKHFDLEAIAIGGLLHDFYYRDWQSYSEKRPLLKRHAFVHAKEALDNSNIYFSPYLTEKSRDIIEKHMFPLNIKLPKYKETWLVSMCDKIVSMETLLHPTYFFESFRNQKM